MSPLVVLSAVHDGIRMLAPRWDYFWWIRPKRVAYPGRMPNRSGLIHVNPCRYYLVGGPDYDMSIDGSNGLVAAIGENGVKVMCGTDMGPVRVLLRALTGVAKTEPDWDTVAEVDIVASENWIRVMSSELEMRPDLGNLACSGPGRYRVRVHARGRDDASRRGFVEEPVEEHLLEAWPVDSATPAALMTDLDDVGVRFAAS
ncbi:hypothetical protein [Frankia gtarii]|uniref:hypothetical protein n=1 Tax=Frankia gtarii TaxID=2950102 RepID=UPI0021BFAE6E|nr:hypothetical protein [Frankia gtarii]